jgi:uncharacterized OB-fold protein
MKKNKKEKINRKCGKCGVWWNSEDNFCWNCSSKIEAGHKHNWKMLSGETLIVASGNDRVETFVCNKCGTLASKYSNSFNHSDKWTLVKTNI